MIVVTFRQHRGNVSVPIACTEWFEHLPSTVTHLYFFPPVEESWFDEIGADCRQEILCDEKQKYQFFRHPRSVGLSYCRVTFARPCNVFVVLRHVRNCLTIIIIIIICLHRMDTTLVNFNEMKWERGDITFLFIGERKSRHSLYILDNKFRVYQKLRYQVACCSRFAFHSYVCYERVWKNGALLSNLYLLCSWLHFLGMCQRCSWIKDSVGLVGNFVFSPLVNSFCKFVGIKLGLKRSWVQFRLSWFIVSTTLKTSFLAVFVPTSVSATQCSALVRRLLWLWFVTLCLSVCLSRWRIVPKRLSRSSWDLHRIVTQPF